MIKRISMLCLAICFGYACMAATHRVNSSDGLERLLASGQVNPGDVIIWANGTYRGQEVRFQGVNGTANNPITLRAETPGGVKFTEYSNFRFGGNYLVAEGFHWEGSIIDQTIVQFRGSNNNPANDCILRNCAITDVKEEAGGEIKWILVYGQRNQITQCQFSGKTEKGAMIIVELGSLNSSAVAGHIFSRNTFSDFAFSEGTNNETIRIGTSIYQEWQAQCIVRENFFYRCNGENEVISLKSQGNIVAHNTFEECAGSVVMRHGDDAAIFGNFFLGNGKPNTGGIRISGTGHRIYNNYMEALTGSRWNGALTIMNGQTTGPTSNGYEKVEDILIAHNTIANCQGDHITFGWGRSAKGLKVVPNNVALANNIVQANEGTLVSFYDTNRPNPTYLNNLFFGTTVGENSTGILVEDPPLQLDGRLLSPAPGSPASNAAQGGYGIDTDIEGQLRGSSPDIGADEFEGASGAVVFGPLSHGDTGPSFLGDGPGHRLEVGTLSSFSATGESKNLNISANIAWNASSSQSWISLSPKAGNNDGVVVVNVAANPSSTPRNGQVTLSGSGIIRTVSITQKASLGQQLSIINATASSSSSPHLPANTLDNDFNTRWSAEGSGQYITYDLGRTYQLSAIKISFHKGNSRVARFNIAYSTDGNQFITAINNGQSSGNSLDFETFNLSPTARYVRYIGDGNTENNWNSLLEVTLWGNVNTVAALSPSITQSHNNLFVSIPTATYHTVVVHQNNGLELKQLSIDQAQHQVNLGKLTSGLYFLKFVGNHQHETVKVFVGY